MTDELSWLEGFYSRLCDGDWEHAYGFEIWTIDNPGWALDFDLTDTKLEDVKFAPVKIERSERDWVQCWMHGAVFHGRGGAGNLTELASIFRRWAEAHIDAQASPWSSE